MRHERRPDSPLARDARSNSQPSSQRTPRSSNRQRHAARELAASALALLLFAPSLSAQLTPLAPTSGPARIGRVLESPPDTPAARADFDGDAPAHEEELYPHSGEFIARAIDLRIPGRGIDFVWQRKYRSRFAPSTAQGNGWDFSYNLWIESVQAGVRLHDGNTRADTFTLDANNDYSARQFFCGGRFQPDGTFRLTFADLSTWTFRSLATSPAPGRIASIADRDGNALTFQYDSQGRLASILDTLNRSYVLAYDGNGHITSLTDFAGRSVTYAYYGFGDPDGSSGDLKSMTTPIVVGTPTGNDFPLGKRTTYTYTSGHADARLNHNLLTIVEPGGRLRLVNEYAPTNDAADLEFDRLVRQRRGMATDTLELSYAALTSGALPASGALPEVLMAILNDRVGNVSELFYDAAGRCVREREYTGRAINGLPTTASSNRPANKLRADDPDWFETLYERDADALVTRIVHPAGNVTRFVRESALDALAPARARGNVRELRRENGTHPLAADQAGGTVELFEYESALSGVVGTNVLRSHVDARGNVTQFLNDALGHRLQTLHRIPSIVEDFAYDAFGRRISHTWPIDGNGHRRRDDYLWYGPADGLQNGYLRARVDDANGLALQTTWIYDAFGNVLGETDPRGNDTQFVRNALEQVLVQRSPPLAGPASPREETRWFYDAEDHVLSVERDNRDETGNLVPSNPAWTTSFAYGARGELVLRADEVDPAHMRLTQFEWDGNSNLTLVRKGEATSGAQPANTLTFVFDERDLLWRTTRAAGDPDASTDQTDYDKNGNERALRRGLEGVAQVETRVHDALDRLRTRTDALSNVTTYHYDPNGNLGGRVGGDASLAHPFAEQVQGELVDVAGSATNRRLSETMHTYDALDRLLSTDARHFDTQSQANIGDGHSLTTQTWTGNSLLATRTLDGGASHVTSFTYDALGRIVQREDASGNRRQWTYDAAGNVLTLTDVDRSGIGGPDQVFATSYAYDALDREILETDGAGMLSAFGWDGLGRRVRETDRGGRVHRFEYDGLDRLVRIGHDMDGNGFDTDPADIVLTQAFDDSSRCVARTDGTFQTTRFAWDALDRCIATQHADGTLEQIGSGVQWFLGFPTPNLASFVSGYDVRDNVVTRIDANGTRTTKAYDLLDRATGVSVLRAPGVGGTTSETWQFDGLSRCVRADVFVDNIPTPASSSVVRGSPTTSGYDSLGNVLRETRTINGGPARTVVATFDGESNLTQLTHPAGSSPLLRVSWIYDGIGRPTSVRDVTGATVTLATIAYAGRERVERFDRLNGTRTQRTWDGLTGVPNPPGDLGFREEIETRHTRIASGALFAGASLRWSQAGMKLDSTDLVSFAPTSYVHDALDRLVHSSSPFAGPIDYALDASGSRTFVNGGATPGSYSSSLVHAYTATPFDARGNDANGNHVFRSTPPRNCVYDYENRLVETNDGANVVRYRYDGLGRCVEKTNGATIERYDYDPLGRRIEVQDGANVTQSQFVHADGSGTPFLWKRAGTRYFLHTDDVGSVTCVTDPSGNVAASYRYSDFGEHVVGGSSTGQGGNLGGMALSDENFHCTLPPSERADDFVLSQASVITSLRWWGGYDCSSAPFTDSFVVSIRDDAGGVPGPTQLLFQFVPNIARTATGAMLPGTFGPVAEYEYSFALNVPFSAAAGVRYWLCIRRAGDGLNTGWSWESSAQGNGTHAASINFAPWTLSSGNRAFSLELAGPAIPLSPFLFHGNWYDADSGLYRIGSRAYEPAVGAFLQRDPDADWASAIGREYTFACNAPTTLCARLDSHGNDTEHGAAPLPKEPEKPAKVEPPPKPKTVDTPARTGDKRIEDAKKELKDAKEALEEAENKYKAVRKDPRRTKKAEEAAASEYRDKKEKVDKAEAKLRDAEANRRD